MKWRVLGIVAIALAAAAGWAHDLFLKPADFFVTAGTDIRLRVLNGTFTKSENAVTRDRVKDIAVVSPSGTARLDTTSWAARGDTSLLTVPTRESGTYLVGASILPREITLAAKDFNAYLASDGVPDVLAERRRRGQLDRPARERYSKHVKALVQVGPTRTSGHETELGYPAELVPLDNPYSLRVGSRLRVKALVDGSPVAGQLIVSGGRVPNGGRIAQRSVRTDSAGIASVRLGTRGTWYVKFIHMTRAVGDTTIDYESKWATLTFALR